MAKKKSFFRTLLKLGGLAAATAAVYYKRDEIKAFLADAAERIFPENAEPEPVEEILETESDIVIDAAGLVSDDKPEAAGETEKGAAEK